MRSREPSAAHWLLRPLPRREGLTWVRLWPERSTQALAGERALHCDHTRTVHEGVCLGAWGVCLGCAWDHASQRAWCAWPSLC